MIRSVIPRPAWIVVCASVLAVAGCRRRSPEAPSGASGGPGSAPASARATGPSASTDAHAASGPSPSGPQAVERRVPVLAEDDPRFGRFEGDVDDPCATDRDCRIGGCSGEICAREPGMSTCEVLPARLPDDARCGCVEGACRWYSPSGAGLGPAPQNPAPEDGFAPSPDEVVGEPCGHARCKPPARCIRHYGIAGPSGPALESCEIPCGPDGACPPRMRCVTVADGPGRVCRPAAGDGARPQ
ncbi:MAG: hypothetical protein D6705_03045 [Deltaproteobacteria bacterium]|nr:MAG: hypothetical protein D6705_03045 [Deltaproteobacteria bacterium]